jgi:hypothetical protein
MDFENIGADSSDFCIPKFIMEMRIRKGVEYTPR